MCLYSVYTSETRETVRKRSKETTGKKTIQPLGKRKLMASAGSLSVAIIVATAFVIIAAAAAQPPATAPMAFGGGPGPSTAPEAVPSIEPAAAPEPSNDCLTPLLNMSDCLTYVETGSNLTAPDKNCCPELAGLLDGNPICLCQLLGGNVTAQYGISIDFGKALKLPSICRVNTPPISLCSAVGYPVAAPTSSQQPSNPPEGFAASPSAGGKDKGASSIARPAAHALFVGLTFALVLIMS